MKVSSFNEWSTLKSVVVGTATRANWPQYDREFRSQELTTRWKETPVPLGPVPEFIIEKTNNELEILCETLTKLSIQVTRPKYYDYQKNHAMYGYCPRDRLLVVGSRVFDVNMRFPIRQQELETLDFIPGIEPVTDPSAVFDAANICRLGQDLLYLVSESGNIQGAHWLQSALGPEYRVHILENVYHGVHIDSTFVPLNQGTIVLNASRVNYENLPKILNDWDCIFIDDCEEIDFYQYPYASKWIGLNMLSVDSNTVICDRNQKNIIKKLEKKNFTVIPLELSHSRTLGGGFHCVTLDLWREDYAVK